MIHKVFCPFVCSLSIPVRQGASDLHIGYPTILAQRAIKYPDQNIDPDPQYPGEEHGAVFGYQQHLVCLKGKNQTN